MFHLFLIGQLIQIVLIFICHFGSAKNKVIFYLSVTFFSGFRVHKIGHKLLCTQGVKKIILYIIRHQHQTLLKLLLHLQVPLHQDLLLECKNAF